MSQLQDFMLKMKTMWKSGEFDDLYNSICMGERKNDVFDVINMEFYILEAVKNGSYRDPDARGIGNVMLGFMYGDILVHNLKNAKWRFKSNPTNWNDWTVDYKSAGKTVSIKPFSRVARFIENCEKMGPNAIEKGSNLKSLLETAKNI